MRLSKILKNTLIVLTACLLLSACATKKEVATDITGQMQGDVYTGTDTVKYLADGVPDRVFFATNESILTTCLLYTSPSPRDAHESRMPSSA